MFALPPIACPRAKRASASRPQTSLGVTDTTSGGARGLRYNEIIRNIGPWNPWKRETISTSGLWYQSPIHFWLVVSTPLKNISQLGLLFPIYGKIKFMFQTTNQIWLVPPRKYVGHVCIFHLFIYQYDLPNLCDHTFSQSLLEDPALPLAKLTSSRGVTVPSPKTGSKKGKRETPGSWVSPSYKSLFKFPNKTTN